MKQLTGKMIALLMVYSSGQALAQNKPTAAQTSQSALGVNVSLKGKRIFPETDLWNRDISRDPVDPKSATYIQSIGAGKNLHPDFGTEWEGVPNGIPYVVVSGALPKVKIPFEYADESDPGPYPLPANPPIEGGGKPEGDRHVLIIDRDNWILYELFAVEKTPNGWKAGSGAIFDMTRNTVRPDGWTSADAAGLPIFPGLVRFDEVMEQKEIRHALRFTVQKTRRAYVPPARHFASHSDDPNLPPMGLRMRLRADYDLSGFPPAAKVILTALKKYGMILADNGSNWFLSGAPDPRWDIEDLATLKRVKGSDFQAVLPPKSGTAK